MKTQKAFICVVTLKDGWKLKTKFKFKLKDCSVEKQKQQLAQGYADLGNRLDSFKRAFGAKAFEQMAIEDVQMELDQNMDGQVPQFFDLDFLPHDISVYNHIDFEKPLDVAIHWRRPHEFLMDKMSQDQLEEYNMIQVFYDTIEPSDIRLGSKSEDLQNHYFLSALSILAQRPPLIERLFITKQWNQEGIYRVRICKGGEWLEVTVDDLFPCEPNGSPIFASGVQNEIWALILEKAYAKVHGSYFLLKGGFVNEALMDLTGCPTSSYSLKDDQVQHFIQNG